MFLWSFIKLMSSLFVMLSVAFITLLERKYLGLSQIRLGVNKTFLVGMTQPLLDAIKLLSKEFTIPSKSMSFWYYLSPILMFSLSLLLWETLSSSNHFSFTLSLLLLMVLLSLKVIMALLVGWMSGSKYSSLGSIRVTAVSVSFEVSFALILYSIQVWSEKFFLKPHILLLLLFLLPFWLVMILCDTMRTPFDLSEAESELVSGLNTEHMSTTFVLLFLAEYTTIIFLSMLTSLLFFQNSYVMSILVFSFILMSRSSYVRVKNDTLMGTIWWSLLPVVLLLLFLLI